MQGPESKITTSNLVTYIDTHCHYQPSVSWPDFFANIVQNIEKFSEGKPHHIAICLPEIKGANWFSLLESYKENHSFHVQKKDEQTLLVRSGEQLISVFCAQQLNTKECIEVIVVGCREAIPSSLPLVEYLEMYSADYLVILPWGVGKWLGSRGSMVSALIPQAFPFILGDNGGRPRWWGLVPQFRQAQVQNRVILAGSDPLPVQSFTKRVAAYGNLFEGNIDHCHDWIREVKTLKQAPRRYGHLCSTLNFIADQLGLRFQKQFKKG